MDNDGLYLYGVIPKKNASAFDQIGMDGQKIFTIEYKDLLAVVSNSSYKVYTISSENLLVHDRVLKEIMEKNDVLPFNFGNVLKSRKDLFNLLITTYSHMWKTLKKVSGRVELGLKVFIKSERFRDEIENIQIKKMKKQLEGLDEKTSYLQKIELGRLVKKSIEEKQKEYEKKIVEYLRQYCVYKKINDCNIVNMILNVAFLVDKEKTDVFDEKVKEICNKYEEKFDFKYSGPWPPYNFIEVPK